MRVAITVALLALVIFSGPSDARKAERRLPGCHEPSDPGFYPQSYMTGFGEYRRCALHLWPKGDPPIDWAARKYRPISSPQRNIIRRSPR